MPQRKRTEQPVAIGRWVVVLSRLAIDEVGVEYDDVVIGPFRSHARAETRARAIRRLAHTYEDPEGCTGDENDLNVSVRPILRGPTSAQDALGVLYGSIEAPGNHAA